MRKIFYTLSLIALTFGTIAQTVVEDFSYGSTAGNLPVLSTLWGVQSGTGALQVQYSPTGLSYSGYGGSGVGGSATFQGGSGTREDINIATSSVYTSGSVYASFLLNVTASGGTTGDYNFHFFDAAGTTTSTNFRSRFFVKDGSVANTFKIGITKAGAAAVAVFSTADYNLNQTYLVVLKYEIVSGATNDICSAFIFSGVPPATEPVTPTVVASDNLTGSDLTQVASFAIRQGSVATSGTIDGLRIGTTWATAPLPVSWKSFTAAKGTDKGTEIDANILKWSTASETNNSHFEIQRSVDGRNFDIIGKVKGGGNSTKAIFYSFSDFQAPAAKTTYYRLKQVDFDGKSVYSKIVSIISIEKKTGLGASLPNPFNNELNVSINAAVASAATVELMDMIGKTHYTSTEQLVEGVNKVTLETNDLPNGIYFIRVTANGETFTQKVIKK